MQEYGATMYIYVINNNGNDGTKYEIYEPKAIVFTIVPNKLKILFTQRVRWAKGMIEGFRRFEPLNLNKNKYEIFLILIDVGIIFFDFTYVFFFIQGIITTLFKYYYIVGLITLITFPLNLIIFSILLGYEKKIAFKPLSLKIRKNIKGYLIFILIYQYLISSVALLDYYKKFLKKK